MDPETRHKQSPDLELIEASRKKDVQAFEELVRRYKRGLVGFAYSMVSDMGKAREVAHDAFCAVYFSLHRLRDETQFSSWLYTIARNFALADRRDRERHQRRFRPLEAEGREGEALESAALASSALSPEDQSDRVELHQKLAACISRLPDPLRFVVNARYFDNLSCNEIAAQTRTPIGTITKRLTRARRMLKDRLGTTFGGDWGAHA